MYFWRSVDGFEVDLLIESAEKIFPIEIKLSSTIKAQHIASLKIWLSLADNSIDKGLIISCSNHSGLIRDKIYNCHFSSL